MNKSYIYINAQEYIDAYIGNNPDILLIPKNEHHLVVDMTISRFS